MGERTKFPKKSPGLIACFFTEGIGFLLNGIFQAILQETTTQRLSPQVVALNVMNVVGFIGMRLSFCLNINSNKGVIFVVFFGYLFIGFGLHI